MCAQLYATYKIYECGTGENGGTECMASREMSAIYSRHVGPPRRNNEKIKRKKGKKGGSGEKGIKAPRNPLAISIHPIGRHTDACWKGFRDSALRGKETEGVAKEVSCPRSAPTMRHIDFIFIPERLYPASAEFAKGSQV